MNRWTRALCLALLALLAAGAIAEAQMVMTPHRVARLRNVGDAVISPDGAHVAFTLIVSRDPLGGNDGPAWTELHVALPDGATRPYITGQVNVSRIAWTPGGQSISFLAKRTGDRAASLYVIPLGGGEARKVLEHATAITSYSWSPDGKRVAFLAADAVPEARRLSRERGFSQEIYEEETPFVRVWVAAVGSDEKPRMLNLTGSASELHWSPAGRQIAVALAPTPLVDDDLMQRRLHIVNADTGAIEARVANPGKLGSVAWSPDGRNLAMLSAADITDSAAARLMVAPATGGAPRDLLPGCKCDFAAFGWQSNDTVMFIADEGVWTTFAKVSLSGERTTIIPTGTRILTAFSLSKDGQSAAFTGQSDHRPSDIFLMKHGEAEPRRITDVNPWMRDIRLAKQEVVKYKARDGVELEGLLIRPLDEQPGTRYPLIVVVHGGPESHYRNGWLTNYSTPGQMAAARGFAVFYPNYRGSTGRGLEFQKLSYGDPAGKEFDDYVDAVDHLINIGLADRAKVGITGGSYGGYATAWGATYYSDRFAAGVMFVGIGDTIGKIGTTDIPWEMYHVHYGYWIWEGKWQKALERSPIYHADKSRTPLLILGGKDDPRVHPSQSLSMYRNMKLRSKAPVRLVRYPGEGHGNRRAASRLDYSLRLMQWMEHYLKGPGGDPPPLELNYAEPR